MIIPIPAAPAKLARHATSPRQNPRFCPKTRYVSNTPTIRRQPIPDFTRTPCRKPPATKLVAARQSPEGSVPIPRHLVRHAASFGSIFAKIPKTRCVSDKN